MNGTSPPEERWDQNQPPLWQWVLLGGVGLFALLGFITTMVIGYQKYNSITADHRGTGTAEERARGLSLTAVVNNRMTAIQQVKNMPVLIQDSFDDNQNMWPAGDIDDVYSEITIGINGTYQWEAVSKQGFIWRAWPHSNLVDDFYLEVEAQNKSANKDAQYGLVFYNANDAYVFLEVRDSGYYRLLSYDGNKWQELIPFTYSEWILPGEVNRISVASVENNIYILVNDTYLDEIHLTFPSQGQAGVAIGLSNEGESTTIVFDNFILRAMAQE
jgi:hypothetical protein